MPSYINPHITSFKEFDHGTHVSSLSLRHPASWTFPRLVVSGSSHRLVRKGASARGADVMASDDGWNPDLYAALLQALREELSKEFQAEA